MSWWLCTEYDQLCAPDTACWAAWVEADSEEDAADLAIELLYEGRERESRLGREEVPLDNVYVTRADEHVAFVVQPHAVRAELQCCGGMPSDPTRHSALCPHAERSQ